MAPPVPEQTRWRVIDLFVHKKKEVAKVKRLTGVSRSSIFRIAARYRKSGEVKRAEYNRLRGLTEELQRELIEIIVESPWNLLRETLVEFEHRTGIRMHKGSLSKIVKQLGISRKKLRSFARKRDEGLSTHHHWSLSQGGRTDQPAIQAKRGLPVGEQIQSALCGEHHQRRHSCRLEFRQQRHIHRSQCLCV